MLAQTRLKSVHQLAQEFLRSLNPNVVTLQHLYGRDRARSDTYEAMVDTILGAVRDGKRVCAAFYGHPGVYVYPSHESVKRARVSRLSVVLMIDRTGVMPLPPAKPT